MSKVEAWRLRGTLVMITKIHFVPTLVKLAYLFELKFHILVKYYVK